MASLTSTAGRLRFASCIRQKLDLWGIFRWFWRKIVLFSLPLYLKFLWNDKFVSLFTTWWLLDCNPIVQRYVFPISNAPHHSTRYSSTRTLSAFCLTKAPSSVQNVYSVFFSWRESWGFFKKYCWIKMFRKFWDILWLLETFWDIYRFLEGFLGEKLGEFLDRFLEHFFLDICV